MTTLIEINNLTKIYDQTIALNNVSFKIPEGQIFALLGPNGAGKTTLLRILTRIILPTSGSIKFKNEPLSDKHINLIGYLPEERGLYTKWKVSEHILYFAELNGLKHNYAKKQAKYWLKKFNLDNRWNNKINELSKGMQQKIQLIITLIHNPELIILDEPFSGFDPINQELIKKEILELKQKGKTIILSTHIMSSVEELADYILLINKGKAMLYGELQQIKEKFSQNIYAVKFSENINLSNSELWQIIEKQNNTYKLKFLANPNIALSKLLQIGQIEKFERILPSINEIFIKVVQNEN